MPYGGEEFGGAERHFLLLFPFLFKGWYDSTVRFWFGRKALLFWFLETPHFIYADLGPYIASSCVSMFARESRVIGKGKRGVRRGRSMGTGVS